MARTSPCFYIAPTAISVSPNANGSASDIAVNVVRGAKIKVYSPGVPALGYSDVSFQQWTLTGRNRRLADNTKPYSIYARLAKSNKEDGYLVFAPKVASGTEWLDKYAYVTVGGLATGTANKNSEDYWYVKLGDVSLPTNNARTVTLDTGILGTDKFNTDWNIDPDQMPLRIELSATIDAKDAGDKPYVEWGKVLTLKANLLEGWANANVQRFHHFTIQRNTGDTSSDKTYNYPPDEKSDSENPSSGRKMPNGSIELSHARGTRDVFNGTVSSIWTVIAWGLKANVADNTSSSSSTSGTVTANVYEKLAEKSINIMAETGEQYALEMSSSVVNYDPSSGTYNPANGIDVMVRATDQRGKVFKLTNAQLGAANLFVQYSLEHPEIWSNCVFTDTGTNPVVAKANIPIKAFEAQKNVNVRIAKAHYLEIYRSHIAFIRKGEKGDKGDPGTPGKDAVTYGVQVTPTYEVWSDAKKHAGIVLTFTKTTGSTMLKYPNVQALGTAKLYVDGTELEGLNKWVNGGSNKIIFDSFTFDGTNNTPTIGTASVIIIELIVDNKIVATANYANGKQGADGKGALEIICDPETIVLDTDDNGLVKDYSNAWAGLMCVRDGKVVGNVTYNIGEHDTVNCEATVNNNGIVTITSVDPQTVAIDGSTVTVSSTSGSVTVSVTDPTTKTTYVKTIPFSVNVAKFNGGLKADNKKLQSQYTELSTNSATKDDLKQYYSKIEQTARNISLKVMEKSVGRRNLLPGSAFRKQGEGCSIVQDGQDAINGICINGGYDGVNCARLRNEGDAGAAYPRISWDGARNSNVKVAKGKKYTLSFWAKRLSSTVGGYEISTQFFLQDGANGHTRPYDALKMGSFTVKSQGEWEFIQDTVTIPSDAKSNYMEVCICLALFQRGMAEILVCRPMLEEGDEYNGWTLSEQDYDYVGGNLLDGTATLAKTGNVETLNPDNVTQGGMGESASISAVLSPTDTNVDFLQFSTDGMGLKANEDYVLSFYAKADSNPGRLQCYLYPSEGYTITEEIEGGYDYFNPSDGDLQSGGIVPGTTWKRYWVHWRPTKADPKHVLFRLLRGGNDRGTYSSYTTYTVDDVVLYDGTYYRCIKAGQGNTPSSSSSYWEATRYQISLSKPKLEVGATMTEWTEKRTDMVDKQALYATGIDIENKKIVATADNFVVRNNRGEPTFSVDVEGNIVGSGGASFNGPMKATTFTLNSTYFSVKEDGTITAKGGQISFFYFDEEGMASGVEYDSSQNKPWRGIGLSSNNISVSGYTGQRISSVFLGKGLIDSRFAGSDKNYIVHRVGSTSSASTFYNYIKLERFEDGHDSYENDPEYAALGIETQGDFCLAALGGPSLFAGMCFASDTVGSSYTADKKHCFYLCSGGTFNMPSDPPDGMLIVVIQTRGRIDFNAGNGHRFQSGTYNSTSFTSDSAGQWSLFYYNNGVWYTIYMTR